MDFKPNEFFIGLVEFITILLPGAVLASILLLVEANHPLQANHALYQYAFSDDTKIIFWVVVIFSSFGLGYFLSSIASGLDALYDPIRKQFSPYEEDLRERFKYNSLSKKERNTFLKVYERHIEEMKKNEYLEEVMVNSEKEKIFEGYKITFANNIFRKLLGVIFKLNYHIKIDRSYEEARKILNQQPIAVRNAANTYKWAGTILEARYPSINEQVSRIMAASKFFRSMVVVSLIYLALQLCAIIPFTFWQINMLILVLSFREYIVQRQKSVQKTYQSIVVLTYSGDSLNMPTP